MLKNHDAAFVFKDGYDMKSENNPIFKETMNLLDKYAYKVRYVPHRTIEDYNATYNVTCKNKHITTNAAKKLGIPLNEIWISELWKPYEKYILFHELREIHHRARGISRNDAHEKALQDGFSLWKNDLLLSKFTKEVDEMDKKTGEKKKDKRNSTA
jgi:competence protein ComEA